MKCGAPLFVELESSRVREGETILAALKPHPMAFLDFYVLFSYLFSIGLIFYLFHGQITEALAGFVPFGWGREGIYMVLWLVCLVLPFLVVAILKITWRWLLLSVGIAGVGAIFNYVFSWIHSMQLLSVAVGLVGFLFVDVYRRKFSFYITDQRIVIELNFFGEKRRELSYSKISDLIVERSFLGRLLNYGSIIPISESGLGLGEDFSAASVGASGKLPKGPKVGGAVTGGRTVSVPRGRSFYVIFGVPNPYRVSDMISQLIRGYEETPYLKKIASDVEYLAKNKKEENEDK